MLFALAVTIVIEGIVMLGLTRTMRWVYYNLLCNMVTNPVLNLAVTIILRITGGGRPAYWACVVIGEAAVVVSEAELYHVMTGEKRGKCYLRSFVTNGISYGCGLWIFG